MKTRYALLISLLLDISAAQAQDPDVYGLGDVDEVLREEATGEQRAESLLLDNTRSKTGRDFYDAFFQAYQAMAPAGNVPATGAKQPAVTGANPADTTQITLTKPLDFELDMFLIAVDELPASSGTGSILSVTVNDELLLQQVVQNRADTIDELARLAAQIVRDYLDSYAETQRQLDSDDQRGSGVY